MFASHRITRPSRALRQAIESLETRRLLSVAFSADFEAPLDAGWTSEGDAIWHRSNVDSQSGDWALYYGDDAEQNYNLGWTSGAISTPTFSLEAATNATLKFSYYMQIETLLAEDVWVQASGDNGANWTTLASSVPTAGTDETPLLNDTIIWQTWEGGLADFATSTVKLRFYFNTNDAESNTGFGFIVDDVLVSTSDTPPSVTSITPSADSVISTASASIEYTFSEAVNGVDATDLTLGGTAGAGASVMGVSGAGNVWTFSVAGLSTGILTTTLAKDAGDITDLAGQSLTPVSTGFQVILPDAYDAAGGNGTLATAANLGLVGGNRVFSPLTLHSTSDEDFYKFVADESGPVTLTLSYVENDWQLMNFYAYDNNQQLIVEEDLDGDGAEALDNTISFDVVEGQTYYIRAYSPLETYVDNYSISIVAPFDAPHVTRVFVKGSTWTQPFLDYLAANSANSSAKYGYAVPTGANQLKTLPWSNLNTISIQFDEPMGIQEEELLMVGSSIYNVAASTFAYNEVDRVCTWQLKTTFVADKLYVKLAGSGAAAAQDETGIALDGEFTTGTSTFPSGDGNVGGDFIFRLNVLPGDANQNGVVQATDGILVRNLLNKATDAAGYSALADCNGNGVIQATDGIVIRNNLNDTLPPNEPLAVFSVARRISRLTKLLVDGEMDVLA